jgi:hypothetical protein
MLGVYTPILLLSRVGLSLLTCRHQVPVEISDFLFWGGEEEEEREHEATSSNPSHRWVVQAGQALSTKLARFSSKPCQFELPKYVGIR